MTDTDLGDDLTGKCLIAMPDMGDPRFSGSVVFLCAYSPEGAMGLIVNKRVDGVHLTDLLDQLSIPKGDTQDSFPIYYGGPVENGRGFVLHSLDYHSDLSTMKVADTFAMTATIDVLEDIGAGRGPQNALVLLGYAGWGPGQLEAEIASNGWLIGDVSSDVIFEAADSDKWPKALEAMGVNPAILSSSGGTA
ncbi:YqgE/AlgH family protein [Planktotalea sp.]|uniref:YqgE/AlgH family protein n=1 Tax=Planktotalea sp. TaxID=2029877 RepID=UPI003299A5D9